MAIKSNPSLDAQAIILRLKALKFTQQEIGEAIGETQPVISLLKTGTRQATQNQLDALNRFYESVKNVDSDTDNTPKADPQNADDAKPEFADYLAMQLESLKEKSITPSDVAASANVTLQTITNIVARKTQNPQEGTRNRLIKAIESLSNHSSQVLQTSFEVTDPITIGETFDESTINESPAALGVYVVHDRRGFPTYVGKGQIRQRLKNHKEKTSFAHSDVAHQFSYLRFDFAEVLKDLNADQQHKVALLMERAMIKFLGNTILLNNKEREEFGLST